MFRILGKLQLFILFTSVHLPCGEDHASGNEMFDNLVLCFEPANEIPNDVVNIQAKSKFRCPAKNEISHNSVEKIII